MRQIPQQVASLKAGTWQAGVGRTVLGKTLGIFGYGRIGKVVAGYGHAFGMNVVVWGGDASRAKAEADGIAVADARRLLRDLRHRQPPPAPGRRHTRDRHRHRPGPNETDCACWSTPAGRG